MDTIKKVIDACSFPILSYIDIEGYPVSKAMLSPREIDAYKVFFFTTNTSSNKSKLLKINNKGSIYFFDPSNFLGVSLVGTFEVLETAEAKERIWREGDTLYYPKGVTDPDYCVLKFTSIKGSLYSNFSSKNFIF